MSRPEHLRNSLRDPFGIGPNVNGESDSLTAMRRITSWLASPRLAVLLLLALGAWSFVGTLAPQGSLSSPKVIAWASTHPMAEPVVALLGLHQAFSSPIFIAMVLLLTASTIVCAWRRTKVAIRRHRLLRDMSAEDARTLVGRPTFSVMVASDESDEPFSRVSEALRTMGLRTRDSDGMVIAASRTWSVYASPVFHWALVGFILVMFVVQLTRAEGLMGVPVRASKPLVAESFGVLDQGAFHRFDQSPHLIRVDKLDLKYVIDGIDRGPAPTVSVLRPDGSVTASQVVYPNNPMRYGPLMIHTSETGLAPRFAVVSKDGVETSRANFIVDYDAQSPSGTTAAEFTITPTDPGEAQVLASVTVPLRKQPGVQTRPGVPRATVVLRAQGQESTIASQTLYVGDEVKLPDGSALRLLGVGYYARLSVVDDPSIPLVYALLIIALVAVSVSILGRQSLAVAVVREHEDGARSVDVWFRDWRANKFRAEQAQEVVRDALTPAPTKNGDAE